MALQLPAVLSGSLTLTGAPVYLAAGRDWTRSLSEAEVFRSTDDLEASLTWARSQEAVVCDPYAFSVDAQADKPTPISARERIRANGPTVGLARAS
ncbi:MAG: DUF2849 domain-containing protein [Polyangiaceae bacterium]|nr:DUF2849 domain-containing protein [Myxococcales bacterium]MCB9589993.1 DUF2849 domain-containing protein [Polyangiaceae bacterium]